MGEFTEYINEIRINYNHLCQKTKTENPIVSVIVPVFNAEAYIEKCILSIIEQSFKDIEIIIVDDGSDDFSTPILYTFKDLDKRIEIIRQKNSGPSVARNVGIQNAKGKYIAFVDADDWIEENYIEKLYESITKNKADIAATSIIRWRIYNKKYRICYKKEKVYTKLTDKLRICNIPENCYVWNKLYKTSLIKDIKFKPGIFFEDVFWTPEVIKKSDKLVTVPNTNYYYRVNNKSIVKNIQDNKKQLDSYNAHKYIIEFFKMNNIFIKEKYKYITKRIIYFGKIPIAKIKEHENKNICYLFNLLPIFIFKN